MSASSVSTRWVVAALVATMPVSGCMKSPETALERLLESRRLAADLRVQFTKTADASNRAVMADTDEASVAFAREAEQATRAAQKDVDSLAALLVDLQYSDEHRLLDEFKACFDGYRQMDRTILDLAVANTNLKAQRLSFGPAHEAAESFRAALEAVVPSDAAKEGWRAKALAATAVSDVREIEVLQAPHIAEANDAVMSDIEKRMAASESGARRALGDLAALASTGSQKSLAEAASALDRFLSLQKQIIELSRRNTNVRSLGLALGQKRTQTASCETTLQALQDILGKRGFAATR
jgi:hypothetical protein